MKFLSLCSGIDAASVAWNPLGMEAVAFSEIEKFPSAVLRHHYQHVPNWGDMTKFKEWPDAVFDVLVGGTPCQSFSVAGLRKGLDDPRGNLMLTYLAIAKRYRPRWVVWENVPGVLSSNKGRDFGTFLGGLGECGYGFAYRVLDAQYAGVPQRRRRVFVVGYLGDWRRAAAVLFERESLQRHSPPRREARERTSAYTPSSIGGYREGAGTLRANGGDNGGGSEMIVAHAVTCHHAKGGDPTTDYYVTHSLRADRFDASEDGTGRGTPIVFDPNQVTSVANYSNPQPERCHTLPGVPNAPLLVHENKSGNLAQADTARALRSGASHSYQAVAFTTEQTPKFNTDQALTLTKQSPSGGGQIQSVMHNGIRRLTPTECERLQGFPDNYTKITDKTADGPRYKALGNSMAVPVMRWIGERIILCESIEISK